jgi:predicted transposase YbfD/YdcC
LDPDALATAIGAWLADRDCRQRRRRAIAVDGKTLRGARTPDGRQVHLLAAMDHTTRAVLAQRQVDGAPGKVPAFQPLLDALDLAGVVVTADALHTQREHAEFLVTGKQADYLFVVKGNQPALRAQLAALPWHAIPVADRTRDRGHGRVELRTLKVATVAGLGFPHAAQAMRITRRVRPLASRRWRTVTVYTVASLTAARASPACLADYVRGHWGIEALHHVRDVTFAEDASQVRTGTAPGSWPACATSPSASCERTTPATWPPPYAATPATPPDPWPSSASPAHEPDIPAPCRGPDAHGGLLGDAPGEGG